MGCYSIGIKVSYVGGHFVLQEGQPQLIKRPSLAQGY